MNTITIMEQHEWSYNCHKGRHHLCSGRRGRPKQRGSQGPLKCECSICKHGEICENIGCKVAIPAYYQQNKRERKTRFCSKCRVTSGTFNYKPIRWACKKCGSIMEVIEYPTFNLYCRKHHKSS